jgi:peptidoglycan/LPS O-acetylase OafA/YrhL
MESFSGWFINLFALRFRPKNQIYTILLIGLFFQLIGIYTNHGFDLGWGVFSYFIAVGRVIVGFYLGAKLRISLAKDDYKGSLKRLSFTIVAFGLNFYLFALSDYFIVFAGPACFFLIREVATIDENYIPRRFLWLCSYLGRISYGIYVWHMPMATLSIPFLILKHSSVAIGGSRKTIFIAAVDIVCVVLATEASIRFVEVPLRKIALRRVSKKK